MVKADTEWARLGQVPSLVDGWPDVKDKVGIATEEFKAGDLLQWACSVLSQPVQGKEKRRLNLSAVIYREAW